MPSGRFAPSPTGPLHLGNLRTALVAWLAARTTGGGFVLRFEDLDAGAVRSRFYDDQARSLADLGLDWDGVPLRQTEHLDRYADAIERLVDDAETFECFCTRREIAEAALAPHGPTGPGYPGTCHDLADTERERRRAAGRRPALRLRARGVRVGFVDRVRGPFEAAVDDVVLVRNDGTIAYNVAVVVDDDFQGVDEVVRADDLVPSTPTQVHLAHLLGLEPPAYLHVPLVLGPTGSRLAKRDGAVTLDDLGARGVDPALVCGVIGVSLGLLDEPRRCRADDLLDRFDADGLPTAPWTIDPATLFEAR